MAKKFWRVNIEITNICNLQCSFCPAVVRSKKVMAPELFEQILTQVAPFTRTVTLHLMGDPLVHPKLSQFVDICAAHGVQIFLVTNGVLLREKEAEILLHPAFQQVSFSLHSFADNFGEKDPTQYLDRIFTFTEKAFEQRPSLYINYRLWNLQDPRGHLKDNRGILERIEKKFDYALPEGDTRVQKAHVVKNRLSLHFDTEFVWPAMDLPVLGERGTCYGLRSHFGVLVDGTVVPCCLDKEGVIPLGKIPDAPLSEILASPRARAMVNGFGQGRLVEDLCKRCNYIERFQTTSVPTQPQTAPAFGGMAAV